MDLIIDLHYNYILEDNILYFLLSLESNLQLHFLVLIIHVLYSISAMRKYFLFVY